LAVSICLKGQIPLEDNTRESPLNILDGTKHYARRAPFKKFFGEEKNSRKNPPLKNFFGRQQPTFITPLLKNSWEGTHTSKQFFTIDVVSKFTPVVGVGPDKTRGPGTTTHWGAGFAHQTIFRFF